MSSLLSGLVKGLSNLMPQDDPNVKIFNAQNEVKELAEQEEAVFARLGRMVFEKQGAIGYPEIIAELELIKSKRKTSENSLKQAQEERIASQQAEQACYCQSCGHTNPVGTNFCQGCGAKLATVEKRFCNNCGTEIIDGSQFCGSCGTRVI